MSVGWILERAQEAYFENAPKWSADDYRSQIQIELHQRSSQLQQLALQGEHREVVEAMDRLLEMPLPGPPTEDLALVRQRLSTTLRVFGANPPKGIVHPDSYNRFRRDLESAATCYRTAVANLSIRRPIEVLHNSDLSEVQRRLLESTGHRIVTGGPGAGKSLVALHLSLRLALEEGQEGLPDVLLVSGARAHADELERLCRGAGAPPNLTVKSMAQLCRDVYRTENQIDAQSVEELTLGGDGTRTLFNRFYRSKPHRDFSEHFLFEEFEYIKGVVPSPSLDVAYLRLNRTGRRRGVPIGQRKKLLELLNEWREFLRTEARWDHGWALQDAFIDRRSPEMKFDHVVVDEYQALSSIEYIYLLASMKTWPSDNQGGRFFLLGDRRQRAALHHLAWPTPSEHAERLRPEFAGKTLSFQGRGRRLSKQWRIPANVMAALSRVAKGLDAWGEVDEPEAESASSQPLDVAQLIVRQTRTEEGVADLVVEKLKKSLSQQLSCVVIAPDQHQRDRLLEYIEHKAQHATDRDYAAILERLAFFDQEALKMIWPKEAPHVALLKLDDVRGYEFDWSILYNFTQERFPLPHRLGDEGEIERDLANLYVALSRSRGSVFIVGDSHLSDTVKPLIEGLARPI